MPRKASPFLLALLLTISFCTVNGQDYVVGIRGDTLRGSISILTYDLIDRIEIFNKDNKEKRTIDLKATQVKEVSFRGNIYHPQKTNDGYRMLQLKTKGYLSLYLAHGPKNNQFEVPCLVKRDGSFLEVPGMSFKRLMESFLADCPRVRDKIETGDLTRKDLDKIVADFNECIDENTIKSKAAEPKAVNPDSPQVTAINNLISKLEKDTSLAGQKDAIDIARDISSKLSEGKTVPRYLTDGLKNTLKDAPAYQDDLKNVLDLLEKH